jgi:hypothetical protein
MRATRTSQYQTYLVSFGEAPPPVGTHRSGSLCEHAGNQSLRAVAFTASSQVCPLVGGLTFAARTRSGSPSLRVRGAHLIGLPPQAAELWRDLEAGAPFWRVARAPRALSAVGWRPHAPGSTPDYETFAFRSGTV